MTKFSVAITVAGESAFVRKIEINQIETFSQPEILCSRNIFWKYYGRTASEKDATQNQK